MSLRVLTLSTLFPDASRPNFGIFVERQTRELACRPNVEVTVIAPRGIPPWPLSGTGRYRTLAALPQVEEWRGLSVRSEEHKSELQSLMRISYAVFCWTKNTQLRMQQIKYK